MKKRWIILSIFIGLLTLCVVAWVGSYWRAVGLARILKPGERELPAAIVKDTFWLEWPDSWSGHWYVDFDKAMDPPQQGFLGFDIFKYGVMAPFWFPILLSALILWLDLRKTMAKPAGRAFPVEPVAKAGEKRP